jgi:hypothetical protein
MGVAWGAVVSPPQYIHMWWEPRLEDKYRNYYFVRANRKPSSAAPYLSDWLEQGKVPALSPGNINI